MSSGAQRDSAGARRRGVGFVISSPSGAGKTTLARALARTGPGVEISVSATTRPPRGTERDGADYFFVGADAFDAMQHSGALLEHASVFGHQYGTPRQFVEDRLARGIDVVFDIDWQGAQQLRTAMGEDLVTAFILPPSFAVLRDRLRGRAEDSEASVARRLAGAREELRHWHEYDYVLVNDDLAAAGQVLASILEAARHARGRQHWIATYLRGIEAEAPE